MPGPFDWLKAQSATIHFGFQFVGVLLHPRADQRIAAAQPCVGRDLAPNALIVGEQAFIRRIGKLHFAAPNGFPPSFHKPNGKTVS